MRLTIETDKRVIYLQIWTSLGICDESKICDTETKTQSAQWVFPFEELPTKVKRGQNVEKKMVASFFGMTDHSKQTIVLEHKKTGARTSHETRPDRRPFAPPARRPLLTSPLGARASPRARTRRADIA
ncbi:hypothetical protein EVAR_86779_1 [Eumeta japonica]|uniref:Uncharacterized protein n=1 Tax=Eumeta variegata TaxID=151549 RepID=A0A4C1W3A6_EUMVA|nr:hypothetical protein EVAR_86779_1 [Eumeta japonica]